MHTRTHTRAHICAAIRVRGAIFLGVRHIHTYTRGLLQPAYRLLIPHTNTLTYPCIYTYIYWRYAYITAAYMLVCTRLAKWRQSFCRAHKPFAHESPFILSLFYASPFIAYLICLVLSFLLLLPACQVSSHGRLFNIRSHYARIGISRPNGKQARTVESFKRNAELQKSRRNLSAAIYQQTTLCTEC